MDELLLLLRGRKWLELKFICWYFQQSGTFLPDQMVSYLYVFLLQLTHFGGKENGAHNVSRILAFQIGFELLAVYVTVLKKTLVIGQYCIFNGLDGRKEQRRIVKILAETKCIYLVFFLVFRLKCVGEKWRKQE